MDGPRVYLESFDRHRARRSFRFRDPVEEVWAFRLSEVIPALAKVEQAVGDGRHAAGFLAYEAAPAFDAALSVHPDEGFPLLWFGIFRERLEIAPEDCDGKGDFSLFDWSPSISRSDYKSAIDQVRDYIAAGDTYQVNYSFRLLARFAGDDFAFYRRLCASQGAAYCAYLDIGRYRILSASPELFFRWEGGSVTARPMKGTYPRGRWSREDVNHAKALRESAKNRAENVMIVDLLRNDLGRIAEFGSVRVKDLFEVERYETLWQMTSTVTSQSQAGITLRDLFRALFPCGSVTGAPKVRTMEIIRELEDSPRRVYTGSIGYVSPGPEAVFNVAIRTVLIDTEEDFAEYGVGGGITYDSISEEEYEECLLKAKLLTEKRPEFELLESLLYETPDGWFLLERHLARLTGSAEYFGFTCDIAAVREALVEAARNLGNGAHKVRLLLDRNGCSRVESQLLAGREKHRSRRVALAAEPVPSRDPFLFHKTTHRRIYDSRMATRPDCDDVLLVNERDEVTESTMANVVVELDGRKWTPPLECGLLAGTFRTELLEEGTIEEHVLRPEDLTNADAIYLINSVRKWMKVELIP